MDSNYKNTLKNISSYFGDDSLSVELKKDMLRLKKEYVFINKIPNYKDVEDQLYNGKNQKEKILFEIKRIRRELKKRFKEEKSILEVLKFIEILNQSEMTYDEYLVVVANLLKIEFYLDMRVGLFKELCDIFERKVDIYTKESEKKNIR